MATSQYPALFPRDRTQSRPPRSSPPRPPLLHDTRRVVSGFASGVLRREREEAEVTFTFGGEGFRGGCSSPGRSHHPLSRALSGAGWTTNNFGGFARFHCPEAASRLKTPNCFLLRQLPGTSCWLSPFSHVSFSRSRTCSRHQVFKHWEDFAAVGLRSLAVQPSIRGGRDGELQPPASSFT